MPKPRYCIDCYDAKAPRLAVPYQSRCRPCLQQHHVRLTPPERAALAAILEAAAQESHEFPALAVALMSASKVAANPRPGQWFLGPVGRALAGDVLRAAALAHETSTGELHILAEHLYRRVMHEDRRTGKRPPWPELLDDVPTHL